jgi:hypothetical protein
MRIHIWRTAPVPPIPTIAVLAWVGVDRTFSLTRGRFADGSERNHDES